LTLTEIEENILSLPKSVNLAVDTISITFLNKENRYIINDAGVLALRDQPCVNFLS